MERIGRTVRTVYGKDLHDEKLSVYLRLDTDDLDDGDTIELVARRPSSDEEERSEVRNDKTADSGN